jgi:hypothetical protein
LESEREAECKICGAPVSDRTDLVEHLRTEHEIVEIASYAATAMYQEDERNSQARELHVRLESLKRTIASS